MRCPCPCLRGEQVALTCDPGHLSAGFSQHWDLAQNTHKAARVRPMARRVWLHLPGVGVPVWGNNCAARRVLRALG